MEVIKEDGQKVVITPDTHVYVDPRKFTTADLPMGGLVDDRRSFVGWGIKAHGNGNYNHAVEYHKPGFLVSQNFTGFKESPVNAYMTPGILIKFWRIKDLTEDEKTLIYTAIANRLKLPAYRRWYDFLGTFVGQFLHIKWIQNPFAEFCSEQLNDDYISPVPRAAAMGIKEPSPSELNAIFEAHPEIMECVGYWWSD